MIRDHGGLTAEQMYTESAKRRDDLQKVNLRYEQGENGEGIWALPCTERDVDLSLDNNSCGHTMYAWLCNDPICPDVRFGSKVAFITNGSHRPYSRELSSPKGRKAYQAVLNGLRHH